MNDIKSDIRAYLDLKTTPISIHEIISALSLKYHARDIKETLWELAADGYVKFDYNWKVMKSNDGGYF